MEEKNKNNIFTNLIKNITLQRTGVFALIVINGIFLFNLYNQSVKIDSLNKTIENLSALNNSHLKKDAQAIFQSSFKDDLVLNSFSNSITIIIAFFTTLIALAAFFSFKKLDEDAKKMKETVTSLRNYIDLELKTQNNLATKKSEKLEFKINEEVSKRIKSMEETLSNSFYEIYKLSFNAFLKTEYNAEQVDHCIITLCGTINYGIEYSKTFILTNSDEKTNLEFYETLAHNLEVKASEFIKEVLPQLGAQSISTQLYSNLVDSYNKSFTLNNFELIYRLEQILRTLEAHIYTNNSNEEDTNEKKLKPGV